MSTHQELEQMASSRIPPEEDDGNKEYKLRLTDDRPETMEHFASQMRYRLEEGFGEAIYTVGVTDSGGIIGLTDQEYNKTKEILDKVAQKMNYTLTQISCTTIEGSSPDPRKMYEFLIREKNPGKYVDIRVACAGQVDSGKSTLLGVLLSGSKDNGRGQARLSVFNYQHEVKTGQTSSVAQHILGFDSKGNPVNYGDEFGRKKSWPEIVHNSTKIVTFFDLCGHEKYLKTTILGLTSHSPDLTLILVGANMGLTRMSKEHIFLCLSLHIPFVVVITKIDICKDRQNVLAETEKSIKELLKAPGLRRIPYDVKTTDDVILSVKNIHSLSTVPIFHISSVTCQGVPLLLEFLNLCSKKPRLDQNANKVEFHVDQIFKVDGVGSVLGGELIQGKIKTGDRLIIGPNDGQYSTVQVRSIQCKRVGVTEVDSGCYVCLGIKRPETLRIHRGNVVLSLVDTPYQVKEFTAEIAVLKSHSTTIKVGYCPIVHTNSVRQSAKILAISNKQSTKGVVDNDQVLRTGDRATVKFRFYYHPEYVKVGFRILLAEGMVKIVGKITEITEEKLNVD